MLDSYRSFFAYFYSYLMVFIEFISDTSFYIILALQFNLKRTYSFFRSFGKGVQRASCWKAVVFQLFPKPLGAKSTSLLCYLAFEQSFIVIELLELLVDLHAAANV
jgi:hypothetical protein